MIFPSFVILLALGHCLTLAVAMPDEHHHLQVLEALSTHRDAINKEFPISDPIEDLSWLRVNPSELALAQQNLDVMASMNEPTLQGQMTMMPGQRRLDEQLASLIEEEVAASNKRGRSYLNDDEFNPKALREMSRAESRARKARNQPPKSNRRMAQDDEEADNSRAARQSSGNKRRSNMERRTRQQATEESRDQLMRPFMDDSTNERRSKDGDDIFSEEGAERRSDDDDEMNDDDDDEVEAAAASPDQRMRSSGHKQQKQESRRAGNKKAARRSAKTSSAYEGGESDNEEDADATNQKRKVVSVKDRVRKVKGAKREVAKANPIERRSSQQAYEDQSASYIKNSKTDLHAAAGHHHGHSHGHYYQYAGVPKKKAWKFGFKRGNHKHTIERHEKGYKNKFHSSFKWHATEKCKKKKKCKSMGSMKWEYKHHDKKKHHHG